MRVCARAAVVMMAVALVGARELDPAACGARFDVQRDKIIRTEESREMGARYLSELDVGTRHECMRLCCETDSCDVFVYEEKSPGSCYLFKCGPPEDFRCKFTAHGNFSSGVLALSRRLAELQDQERLARHDQQLASLRGATSSTAAPSTPAASTRAPPPPAPPRPPRPPDPPRRCSRYQFECRRGGECIAVYNACDGVPQCADGSDEAPELGCPAPAPPVAAAAAAAAGAGAGAGAGAAVSGGADADRIASAAQPAPAAVAAPPRQQPPYTPSPPAPQLKPMQVLGDPVDSEGSLNALEPAEVSAERWPHRLTQAQPPLHRYNAVAEVSRGPHIFSHKGGLLQETEPAPPPYAPYDPPWARRLWPQQSGEWGAGGVWGELDPRRAWPVPARPPEMSMYAGGKTMPELPIEYAGTGAGQQTLHDAPKKGLALEPAPAAESAPAHAPAHAPALVPARAPALASAPAPPVTAHVPAPSTPRDPTARTSPPPVPVDHHERTDAGAAAPLAAEEDGLSEHPPAAILLLVLGVAMTAVMGALVGCRARAARRRLRRGKSPLAHDADYLVNGMYL